ncbi:MAG: Bug family tripartite tricarboxylate transporter substrate binding protein [Pseudomonadota bacterium]
MKLKRMLWVAFGLLLGASAAAAQTGKYPNQPIRIIVPFAPGGASDFAARVIQQKLGNALGQQIYVEHRAGAAGNIGMDAAARAPADGHHLFLGNIGTVGLNPYIFADLNLKPLEAFIPISILADTPSLLVTNANFPPNSVKELIEYVQARPGKVNYASPGSGSMDRLEMELFRKLAKLDMNHVPYKGGAAPALNDVIAGHVELMFVTISSALPHVKAGKLKALTVSMPQRVDAIPDVPTIVEAGFPQAIASSWQGLLVPAGTPKPIVERIHAAVVEVMQDAEVKKRFADVGVIATFSKSPEDFRKYIVEDAKKWEAVIKDVSARPD